MVRGTAAKAVYWCGSVRIFRETVRFIQVNRVPIDPLTVQHIASLAQLEIPDERMDGVAADMDRVIALMRQIEAFEETHDTERPVAPRRVDSAEKTPHAPPALPSAHLHETGAVTVPPIKGKS